MVGIFNKSQNNLLTERSLGLGFDLIGLFFAKKVVNRRIRTVVLEKFLDSGAPSVQIC